MTGSPTPGSVRTEAQENALKAGNPVKTSTGAVATASKPLYADSSSLLASGAFPFALPINQPTTTSPLLDLTGIAASAILTRTLVAAGEVTTFTVTGYARVLVTDDGNQITDGSYYIAFGTIV